jgi:hypothetical protein
MNKNYVTDVNKFCAWLGMVKMHQQQLDEMMIEAVYQLDRERSRLKATKMRKDTTKSYDNWVKNN